MRCAAAILPSAALIVAACTSAGPIPLVRDEARIFSPGAEQRAEARLRSIGVRVGIWPMILTHDEPDPPRMLDDPMSDANALGVDAFAILLGPDRYAGSGYSRDELSAAFTPPSHAEVLLGEGRADEALDVIVRHLEAWSRAPGD